MNGGVEGEGVECDGNVMTAFSQEARAIATAKSRDLERVEKVTCLNMSILLNSDVSQEYQDLIRLETTKMMESFMEE